MGVPYVCFFSPATIGKAEEARNSRIRAVAVDNVHKLVRVQGIDAPRRVRLPTADRSGIAARHGGTWSYFNRSIFRVRTSSPAVTR